jgi:heterodisulfide reductase subunit A
MMVGGRGFELRGKIDSAWGKTGSVSGKLGSVSGKTGSVWGRIGSVLVLGAGISGIQTSLDLAESGYFVHLVEQSSAIGGTMPMLDKTFPTHDCSICILSPKLVECGRHLNIKTYTNADLADIQGEPGNFRVRLCSRPRFVDLVKCKNCGQCVEVCPVHAGDEFNQGLDRRAAIYKLYPQAFPDTYVIDPEVCKRCRACEKVCPSGAIDLDQEEEIIELAVGAVVLSPGFEKIDPHHLFSYGYGRFPNVLTSLEFERILSSGGPFGGNLVRPYDHRQPEKIAWIQCAGSRSVLDARGYCSSVCCRYAIKEAVMAKEHSRIDLDTVIFFMDIRAYTKGLEKYYNTAKDVSGVRFIRSRVSEVVQIQDERKNLLISFSEPGVGIHTEEFDLVVLSLGFKPPAKAVELCRGSLKIDLNQYHFAEPERLSGVGTSRKGIYVAGAFAEPKCISETVTQAIATCGTVGSWLASARGTLIKEKIFPPEKNLPGEIPRIGVFVCHCGSNIGQVVRVADVAESARQLPYVVYAGEHLHVCAQNSQASIKDAINRYNLNRVVIASCSPATHRPLFQETVQEAGLNKYLCEMANIRDQCAWVHRDFPDQATEKAKELVRMKVVKLAMQEPIKQISVAITRSVLIIGGGISGMTSALCLASEADAESGSKSEADAEAGVESDVKAGYKPGPEAGYKPGLEAGTKANTGTDPEADTELSHDSGYEVHLVEKSDALGGLCRRIRQGFKGEDVQSLVSDLISRVNSNPRIKTYLSAETGESCGSAGNFITTLTDGRQIRHGTMIIATGGREYKPVEYLYGRNERVMTYLEMEEALARGDERVRKSKNVVLINCVGSREPDRPYCSRVCCHKSIKLALDLVAAAADTSASATESACIESASGMKSTNPQVNIFVLYRDMRTYGFMEDRYREARLKGVTFIRYEAEHKPVVEQTAAGGIRVTITDHVLMRPLIIEPDLVGLAAAILPGDDNTRLSQLFKVPLDEQGFFHEAHLKLRPVDCAPKGIFLAGVAHGPKNLEENLIQAKAAAGRAAIILSKPDMESQGVIARVNPDKCVACLTCVRLCLFNAPKIKNHVAEIEPSACQGCGTCIDECPKQAITLQGYNDHAYAAMTECIFAGAAGTRDRKGADREADREEGSAGREERKAGREEGKAGREGRGAGTEEGKVNRREEGEGRGGKEERKKEDKEEGQFEPKIVAFCCSYCAYAAADLAGSLRLQYPHNIRVIEVPCSGDVGEHVLIHAFEHGADGVFVGGCLEGNCHFLQGNCHARKRVDAVKKILDEIGLSSQRLEMYNLSAAMGHRFVEIAYEMTDRVRRLGPNPFSKAGRGGLQG